MVGYDSDIDDTVLDLFLIHQIQNEIGLSLLSPSEFPSPDYGEMWGISTFRKAFAVIVSGVTNMDSTLEASTTFSDIRKFYKATESNSKESGPNDDDSLLSVGDKSKNTSQFSLKAIQAIELNEYSGETEKYIEWF